MPRASGASREDAAADVELDTTEADEAEADGATAELGNLAGAAAPVARSRFAVIMPGGGTETICPKSDVVGVGPQALEPVSVVESVARMAEPERRVCLSALISACNAEIDALSAVLSSKLLTNRSIC